MHIGNTLWHYTWRIVTFDYNAAFSLDIFLRKVNSLLVLFLQPWFFFGGGELRKNTNFNRFLIVNYMDLLLNTYSPNYYLSHVIMKDLQVFTCIIAYLYPCFPILNPTPSCRQSPDWPNVHPAIIARHLAEPMLHCFGSVSACVTKCRYIIVTVPVVYTYFVL
jgi:hypothetical protein